MANKYYYLTSSFPHIAFGKAAPVKREHFLSECQKWLDHRDLAALLNIDSKNIKKDTKDKGFTREWKEFDVGLRRALAESRAARKVSHEERILGVASEILDQANPLDMERHFEKIRWNFLDEKETDYHFDLNWLMVYYLKLQISERLASFEKEKGAAAFEEACEVVYE